MSGVIDQLFAHRSVRKFKPEPIDDQTLETLVSAAQCASTSHHVQACTLIRVKDVQKRAAIAELAGPQPWVASAPIFLVFCADLTRLAKAAADAGQKGDGGWTELFLVATVDTAILAQNLMVAAESMGLGGVFIGGIRNDPQQVCDLLEIPDLAYPVFGMCLGVPDEDHGTKPRLPLPLVLRTDTFAGSPADARADQDLFDTYDKTLSRYYQTRNANLKTTTWTRQMARFMALQTRPHMKSFLEKKGFLKK